MSFILAELPPHRHRVYGLTVAAWTNFPELPAALPDAPVDVVFRLGEVPAELPGAHLRGGRFEAEPGRLLAWVDGVARYLVRDGMEIIVEPLAGAADQDVRTLLLCSPMGALLHQRGVLSLHASAIATPQGAVVFAGHSGQGKSTLAAHFHRRGHRILADDIAAVSFNDAGQPVVAPGLPQFKLWPDALAALGQVAGELPRVRATITKRSLRFPEAFQSTPLPLVRLYFLMRQASVTTPGIEPLPVHERLRRLAVHTYRANFVRPLGRQPAHFAMLGRLAAAVPIQLLNVPASEPIQLEAMAEALIADFPS